MVERITSFLGDNGYTRAWGRAVEGWPIIPLERMMTDDVETARLQELAARQVRADGSFRPELEKGLGLLTGSEEKAQKVLEVLGAGEPEGRADLVAGLVRQGYEKASAKQRVNAASAMLPRDGVIGLSPSGEMMRAVAGSPVLAYGLPAAGVGLAAWGIHDVVAAQQRAEKEGQLPVQGGVQ